MCSTQEAQLGGITRSCLGLIYWMELEMRYARRVDSNQGQIVEALRAAGARVKVIHQPVDLKLWATHNQGEHRTMYVEVKNPKTGYGKKGLNDKQAEEMDGVPCATVDSVEAALRALAVLRASL